MRVIYSYFITWEFFYIEISIIIFFIKTILFKIVFYKCQLRIIDIKIFILSRKRSKFFISFWEHLRAEPPFGWDSA